MTYTIILCNTNWIDPMMWFYYSWWANITQKNTSHSMSFTLPLSFSHQYPFASICVSYGITFRHFQNHSTLDFRGFLLWFHPNHIISLENYIPFCRSCMNNKRVILTFWNGFGGSVYSICVVCPIWRILVSATKFYNFPWI